MSQTCPQTWPKVWHDLLFYYYMYQLELRGSVACPAVKTFAWRGLGNKFKRQQKKGFYLVDIIVLQMFFAVETSSWHTWFATKKKKRFQTSLLLLNLKLPISSSSTFISKSWGDYYYCNNKRGGAVSSGLRIPLRYIWFHHIGRLVKSPMWIDLACNLYIRVCQSLVVPILGLFTERYIQLPVALLVLAVHTPLTHGYY